MPRWLESMIAGGPCFSAALGFWNWTMSIVQSLLGMSPQEYSPGAWTYITDSIYPWFMGMGAMFLNMFALIGFCRQASNLKENVTMEMWVELFIKIIICNTLLINGLSIMQEFTGFASDVTSGLLGDSIPQIYGDDIDLGFSLSMVLFGPLYLILVIVCATTILEEVMSRFLNLYLLIGSAPLALCTIAGGRGMDNTAVAWFKSFLTSVMQIAAISFILQICSHIINSSTFGAAASWDVFGWFNGAGNVLMSIVTVVFLTAAVKGSDAFLKRAFDLR